MYAYALHMYIIYFKTTIFNHYMVTKEYKIWLAMNNNIYFVHLTFPIEGEHFNQGPRPGASCPEGW